MNFLKFVPEVCSFSCKNPGFFTDRLQPLISVYLPAGELWHVSVQRQALHPRWQRGKWWSYWHHLVLRPSNRHHHRSGSHATANLLPWLCHHPPLQWQVSQVLTINKHTDAQERERANYTSCKSLKLKLFAFIPCTAQTLLYNGHI